MLLKVTSIKPTSRQQHTLWGNRSGIEFLRETHISFGFQHFFHLCFLKSFNVLRGFAYQFQTRCCFFVLRRRRRLISFSVPGLVWNSLQILLKVLSTRPPGTCGPVVEKSMLCLKLVSTSHQTFETFRKHKAKKCWISNEIYVSVRKFIPDRLSRNVCYCLLVGLMDVTFRSIYSEFLHKPGPTESQ